MPNKQLKKLPIQMEWGTYINTINIENKGRFTPPFVFLQYIFEINSYKNLKNIIGVDEMNEIKLSLDRTAYKTKPTGDVVGQISNRIGKSDKVVALGDPQDFKLFAEYVGNQGFTFSPATFKNESRSIANFEQMQLLALDFDKGITLSDVMDRSTKYNTLPFMAYETLTSEGQNKFRVLFQNNTTITDKRLAKITLNALTTIFPEADSNCDEISRMFFGGKKLLHFDDSLPTVDTESLLRNMTYYLKNKRGLHHYKQHVKRFAEKHGIRVTKKGLIDISMAESETEQDGTFDYGKNLPSSILLIKDHGNNLPNSYYHLNFEDEGTKSSVDKNHPKKRTPFRTDDLPKLSNCCQLFREFETGNRWLDHKELFGLSTTMIHVENGIGIFKKILSGNPNYYDLSKQNSFDFYLQYNKEHGYEAQSCEFFCPYKDTCSHGKNILSTVKPKCSTMERVANYAEVLYPIEEVQDDLLQKLEQAIQSNDKLWHIIKAQTAAGKTEAFLRLMKTSGSRFLIAVPTNKLKQDIGARADEKGLAFIATPSLDEIKAEMPADVWSHIQHLRNTGQHKKVHTFICRMAEEKNIKCLQEHLKRQKEYEEHDGHTITTHRRLMNMSEKALGKYDAVILDEDIILSSIATNQGAIPIPLLKKIRKQACKTHSKDPNYNKLIGKINRLFKAIETDTMFKLGAFNWDDGSDDSAESEKEDVDGISALTDIPSFCLAEHFIYRKASEEEHLKEDCIVFLKPWKFKNIKHIMVSATVDKDICEYCFSKQNVNFYECKRAAYIGVLNQYYDKSMSRSCIDGHPGIIQRIRDWSGFRYIITFKKYAIGDMHFGNAIGCDHLKGKDIDVVGTPYQVEFVYKLLPFTLGIHINNKAKMKICKVTHNGYIFHFKTFGEEHEVLRKFHIWMIESELEQAVGRARLLRCDCTVNLFSNFPLRQAALKESEYDNK